MKPHGNILPARFACPALFRASHSASARLFAQAVYLITEPSDFFRECQLDFARHISFFRAIRVKNRRSRREKSPGGA